MGLPLISGGRFRVIFGLVLLALAVGALLYYLSDPPLEADVVDKRCDAFGGSSIVVKTRLLGIVHASPVDLSGCGAVPLGAFVVYHVRSKHTIVYEVEGGRCLWDSAGLCR